MDDEVAFSESMARLLRRRGYLVTAVDRGERALEALEEGDVDVVVLDLQMPGLGGLATLRAIRQAGHFVEVLILTGHGAIESAQEAMEVGAYDYLTKPCDVDELVAKLEGAGERREGELGRERSETIRMVVQSPSPGPGFLPRRRRRPPAS